jgi:diguanylate cyclase (GGDEF)-like protein/PAS domain S-box-containing protein
VAARIVVICYGAWMSALTVAYFTLPEAAELYLWTAIGLSGVLAVVVGAWRNAPRRRGPWLFIAAALLCLAAGDLVGDVYHHVLRREIAYPSAADAFYLLMYPMVAVGLVGLHRLGVVRRDAASVLDPLILTVGVGLLSWLFLISPYLTDPDLSTLEKATSAAYPLLDLLLLATGVRLIAAVRRTPAVWLLAAGGVAMLGADLVYGVVQLWGSWEVGGPVDAGWIALHGLWGAAALHPSMRELTEPRVLRRADEGARWTLAWALASLIAPAVLFVKATSGTVEDAGVIAAANGVLALLVLARLSAAAHVHRSALARERALREAGAGLLSATDVDSLTTVVRDAVGRFLPPGTPHRVVLTTDSAHVTAAGAGPTRGGRVADGLVMVYTRQLDRRLAHDLGNFEVTLHCPLRVDEGDPAGLGTLYIAADDTRLLALQEAAQVLATEVAMALDRILLSQEIDRRNSEAYFRTLVLNTADVILILDDDDRIGYASPSASTLFIGANLTGVSLVDLVEPDSAPEVGRRVDAVRAGYRDRHERDWRVRRPGGRAALAEVSCRDLRGEPTVRGLVVTLRDVTESRRLERELYRRATFDSLTGLPNREVFLNGAQLAVELAAAAGVTVAVLIIGLDEFSVVNNTMGHPAGDELLLAVGQRLAAVMRTFADDDPAWPGGTVARLGGDEFAALARDAAGPVEVEQIAERLRNSFAEPFVLSRGAVVVTASMGVATTSAAADAQELLHQADLAMYVAKNAGPGGWVRYNAALHTSVVERLKLRSELDQAIMDGDFDLVYQPITDLLTGWTVGLEALVRWNHPTRGVLNPRQFIDLAEESGLIVPLGEWILRKAIRAASHWRQSGHDGPYVSVNVSTRQLRVPGFVDLVRRELVAADLPPESLLVEITESLLLHEDDNVEAELSNLRKEGIHIAIDDFGTGFSALSYLRRLQADVLKLDKSFIDTISTSPDQYAVVNAIIQLAQTLRLKVIAEGIETRVDHDLLVAMGCGYAQGYLIARPMSYDDALTWVARTTGVVGGDRSAAA